MKLFGAPIGKCLFAFLLLAIIFQLAISACRSSRQGFYEGAGEDGLEEGFYEGVEHDDVEEEEDDEDEGFYEGEVDDGFQEGFDEGFYEGSNGIDDEEGTDESAGESESESESEDEESVEGFYEGDEDKLDGSEEESGDDEGMEGFTGSDLNYQMGRGVVLGGGGKACDQRKMGGSRGPQTQGGYKLPPTRMAIFDGVRFAPECCPSAYSNSTGCACAPKNLERYVAETRAGNNTKNCTSF